MIKYIAYTAAILCAALLTPSCSKDTGVPDTGNGTGTLIMKISATRADSKSDYDPFDHATICIYNGRDELTREYKSLEDLPASLELLAGDYCITVDAGDNSTATFTNRTYRGKTNFTISAGTTQNVQVECLLVNTIVEVKFDKSVTDIFGKDFHAWVMTANAFDLEAAESGRIPALQYTTDAKGYFILPDGIRTFACQFEGKHPQRGTIVHTQLIEEVKPRGKYVLTYKFSPDLPGFISLKSVTVDTSEEEEDDTIIFSPDPTLTGVGFDVEQPIRYTTGDKSFNIASIAALQNATLTVDGTDHYDLMNASAAGITVVINNANSLTMTLGDEFFANRTAGDHSLRFNVTDNGNGALDTEAICRLQGLIPVKATDRDLWKNTLILRAVSFGGANSVTFGLRTPNGEWQELTGTSESPDFYTATFAPEWEATTNAHDIAIYRIKSGTGIFAGKDYEYHATVDGVQSTGSFSKSAGDAIPGGNMEGDLSCFTTNNTGSATWGSGNNSMKSGLCTKASSSAIGEIGGAQCAKLTASQTLGMLASGNLFLGTFVFSGMTGPGTVGFGQNYAYTARPSALSVRYHAKVGKVNVTKHEAILPNGAQDISTIFVCIVDWSARHDVTAGTGYPSGVWDPEKQTDLSGSGKIIAYGKLNIDSTTEGGSLVPAQIPLNFYNTEAASPTGKYTLVISCSTSMYGDYMNGCDSNVMYVDDFEWVY